MPRIPPVSVGRRAGQHSYVSARRLFWVIRIASRRQGRINTRSSSIVIKDVLSETWRNISHKRSIEAIARTARSGAVRSWYNLRIADEPGYLRAYIGLFNPDEKKRRSRSPAHPLAATEPYGSLLLLLFFGRRLWWLRLSMLLWLWLGTLLRLRLSMLLWLGMLLRLRLSMLLWLWLGMLLRLRLSLLLWLWLGMLLLLRLSMLLWLWLGTLLRLRLSMLLWLGMLLRLRLSMLLWLWLGTLLRLRLSMLLWLGMLWLRLSMLLRSSLRLSGRTSYLIPSRLVLIRTGCSRLIRSCLVLGGLVLGCLIRSRLVLIRAGGCSCLVLGGLGLGCLIPSRLVLIRTGCSCLGLGCLIPSRPVLVRTGCSCFIRSCLILGGGSLVRCSRLLGRYHSMTAKLRRLHSCSDCRTPVVHGRQECVVGTGSLHMLGLQRRWRPVLLVCRCFFCLGRAGGNSTGAAVIADIVDPSVVDYGLVVNVVNAGDIHVVHRTVVVKLSVLPTSALIAGTTIAKAVVDPTVEADLRTPVTVIPAVGVAAPAPITGSPEQTNLGSHHPRTRHPEVAFIPICPVAGRPDITGGGHHGLCVHRQRGRSDRDRNRELRERGSRYSQY